MSYPPNPSGGYPGYPPTGGSAQPWVPGMPPQAPPPGQPSPYGAAASGYPPYPSTGGGGGGFAFGTPQPPAGPTPYPPAPSGYPPGPPQSGHPPGQSGYPPAHSGYLPGPPQSGYPTAQSGYPPGPPPSGYPSGQSGYPPGQSGYPPGPPQSGYPSGQSGYPPAQSGYPPGPAPYGSQAPPPPGSTSGYPPNTQQTTGGYSSAPPPVPSAATHPSSHAHKQSKHKSDVAQATKKMAAVSIAKEPPTQGTVTPRSPFDSEEDATTLRNAMKGFGTDEKAIIAVLAYRSNEQRQDIKRKFKSMFGKDLIKELKSELSGHFEAAVLALLMTATEFDAHLLKKSIQGLGTDEGCMIELLCTRNNQQIEDIKARYKKDFGSDLEKDVKSDTSGHFQRLMISMLTGARDPYGTVDKAKARSDAQALYRAGEAKWGTDESVFNQILAARSFTHLKEVFNEYSKICKYDIEQSVSREMSGDLKNGMLTIVKCVRDRSAYFAERLYKSMKGLGTDDDTLVRVMVTRCEVDMVQIKKKFYEKYHKTLGSFIKGDTSGDYKRILLALARED